MVGWLSSRVWFKPCIVTPSIQEIEQVVGVIKVKGQLSCDDWICHGMCLLNHLSLGLLFLYKTTGMIRAIKLASDSGELRTIGELAFW